MKTTLTFLLLALAVSTAQVTSAAEDSPKVFARNPSSSPSGTQVVFESDYADPTRPLALWVSGIDGTGLHKLTNGQSEETEPSWSPDGKTILFTGSANGVQDIWTVNPDGTGLHQLTSKSLNNSQPAWSSDGSKIVFVSNRGGTSDIWIMNSDGTGQKRLTTLPGQENHPSFSPDGSQIVFSETTGSSANLLVVNTNGTTTPTAITQIGFSDWNPQWSANGIVFSSNRDATSEHWKIWWVQPDGSGLAKIGDVVALDPTWLPTGKILFTDEIGGPTNAQSSVTLLDPATAKLTIVSNLNGFRASIKVRPNSYRASIYPNSDDPIAVAIFSTTNFDAVSSIDQQTITFGATGSEKSLRSCSKKRPHDLNNDGIPDLVCYFNVRLAGFRAPDRVAILRFVNKLGTPYEGRDTVIVYKGVDGHGDKDDD